MKAIDVAIDAVSHATALTIQHRSLLPRDLVQNACACSHKTQQWLARIEDLAQELRVVLDTDVEWVVLELLRVLDEALEDATAGPNPLDRRDLIVEGVNSIPGFKCHKPLGAFYVFPNITATGIDSRTLAKRILDEAGVACLSGTSFGKFGEGYIRFSYANSRENIEKAIDRIQKFMRTV